jgi:hypothetical protein
LALASCAGSRFRETNHEFVQSNECEVIDIADFNAALDKAREDEW